VLLNLQRIIEAKRRESNQVAVVLVTTDLEAGQVLDDTNAKPILVPREVADKARGLYRFDDVERGVTCVHRRVGANDLLRVTDMQQSLAVQHALTGRMDPGRRAISFEVDRSPGSAHVRPGARVDLYGAVLMPGQPARTQLIIENLDVLSVDGQTDPDQVRPTFSSIEVHVPATLVANLKEVQRRLDGKLTVAVRAPGDMEMIYPYKKARLELGGKIADPVLESLARQLPAARRGGPRGLGDD